MEPKNRPSFDQYRHDNVNNRKGKQVQRISGSAATPGETPHLLYFALLTEG
jgi:hypothetical protein